MFKTLAYDNNNAGNLKIVKNQIISLHIPNLEYTNSSWMSCIVDEKHVKKKNNFLASCLNKLYISIGYK